MELGGLNSSFKTPLNLYTQCLNKYVNNLNFNVTSLDSAQILRFLPAGILIDIYAMIAEKDDLMDMLLEQLSELDVFERLIRFNPARQKLFYCLSALMNNNRPLAKYLQRNFLLRHKSTNPNVGTWKPPAKLTTLAKAKLILLDLTKIAAEATVNINKPLKDIEASDDDLLADDCRIVGFGLLLGSFLSEAGWLSESIQILICVLEKLRFRRSIQSLIVRLDCLQRLLHAEAALRNFKEAGHTLAEIVDLLKILPTKKIPASLLANTYTQFSAMHFARSEYDESHMWSVVAMRHLNNKTPAKIAIDVLRQAAKSCVVKRDFQRANILICQATRRAKKYFGKHHQKYADTLLDYGFFLLNVDSIYQSVNVYKEALDIKRMIFGSRNYHVAIVHEDLSYAYYVHEYSTGNFSCSREQVEKAVDIMKDLVPHDHLMLASAKRVKALLLEEIALDKMSEGIDEDELLEQSEELHKFALNLSLQVLGEMNVQTAKHYGNLGRLYQTMNRFGEAEQMHQKAIRIKTDLLGAFDYEVGLSIGHLASLYNYQMKKYREAEALYLRSIEISLRLFGRSYSGLEYDYLGLCHVYETLREFEKYLKYATILENWQVLRSQNVVMNNPTYPTINQDFSLEDTKLQFFSMCTQNLTACN